MHSIQHCERSTSACIAFFLCQFQECSSAPHHKMLLSSWLGVCGEWLKREIPFLSKIQKKKNSKFKTQNFIFAYCKNGTIAVNFLSTTLHFVCFTINTKFGYFFLCINNILILQPSFHEIFITYKFHYILTFL